MKFGKRQAISWGLDKMGVSRQVLNEFYQVGWEQRWIARLNDNFVPGDAGYKYRLFKTMELIKFSRNAKFTVFDLGCGVGIYSIQILKKFKNAHVWAVDLSAKHIKAAQQLAEKAGVSKRINFAVADVSEFSSDIKPDLILVSEILEHLPKPISAIENIKQLASKDSQIIISVPNKIHKTKTGWVFHRQITGDNFDNIQTENIKDLDDGQPQYTFYHKEYSPQEIQNLLATEGFKIKNTEFCFFQHPLVPEVNEIKKFFVQILNYINRRLNCEFFDTVLGWLFQENYYETIILDCSIDTIDEIHAQRDFTKCQG